MSTRSGIEIYAKGWNADSSFTKVCSLYKHCDGYLTGTGLDILKAIKASNGDRDFLYNLLQTSYGPDTFQLDENVTLHRDLEYVYRVYLGNMEHKHDVALMSVECLAVSYREPSKKEEELLVTVHKDNANNFSFQVNPNSPVGEYDELEKEFRAWNR